MLGASKYISGGAGFRPGWALSKVSTITAVLCLPWDFSMTKSMCHTESRMCTQFHIQTHMCAHTWAHLNTKHIYLHTPERSNAYTHHMCAHIQIHTYRDSSPEESVLHGCAQLLPSLGVTGRRSVSGHWAGLFAIMDSTHHPREAWRNLRSPCPQCVLGPVLNPL